MAGSSDAVDREAAWFRTTGDGLPSLLAPAGPFQVVQAYWPRTPAERTSGQLYVLRRKIHQKRFANQRRMDRYEFQLRMVWPLSSGAGNAETDQRAFDAAVELVLVRLGGFRGDKTHGGRFLQVAEGHDDVVVDFDPPWQHLQADIVFRAEVTYWADDFEITG